MVLARPRGRSLTGRFFHVGGGIFSRLGNEQIFGWVPPLVQKGVSVPPFFFNPPWHQDPAYKNMIIDWPQVKSNECTIINFWLMTNSAASKGWQRVNYREFLAFDCPYLSCNDHCDWWVLQEMFFINIF